MSHRVVILGGGFAGAYAARALERAAPEADVLLLDQRNYFVFYPLLVEAGIGRLEPRHAVVGIRDFLGSTRFRMGQVVGVDAQRRTVRYRIPGTELEREVEYDHLVLALGSVTRLPPVPGLAEYGYQMKTLMDAVGLRDRAIQLLEIADAVDDADERRALLRFVVVGASFSGVEVAGELLEFIQHAARRYRNVSPSDCSVSLIEMADRILPALDIELAAYAARELRRRGMDIRLGESVAAIHPDRVDLASGGSLPTRTVIWCAGVAPPPLLAELPFPTQQGYVLCRRDLRVEGFDNVWAIGDCAVNSDPDGHPYPATAQHAIQQAKHLAANLAAVFSGQSTTPCNIQSRGSLATLGGARGIARVYGRTITGFPAWFLWRTFYLLRMPGLGRSFRVAMDWTLQAIFPRDVVQLGVHRVRLNVKPIAPSPSPHGHGASAPQPEGPPQALTPRADR